jgi:multiple sugar transport system substrate-binding protein
MSRRKLIQRTATLPIAASALGASLTAKPSRVAAQDQVNLTVLTHWGTQAYLDAFNARIAEYEELNPNVKIEHQTVAFAELLSRITTGQLGGDAPDISHFYNLWLPDLAGSQIFATPPDDVVADIQEAYAPGTVEGASYSGQVWGYPTEVNVWQLLYNKQMFEEAGITAPPETWAEFRETAEALTQRDSSGTQTRAGMLFLDTWDSGVVHPWTSLLWSNGGEYVSEDHSTSLFNSPEGLETLQLQTEMLNDGSAMSSVLEDGDFLTGQAAMTIMANFWGADLRAGMEGGIENVGVAPIPHTENNTSTAVQYQWLWGVGNTSERAEQAWDFLRWLNSPREANASSPMGDYLTSGLNAIPGRISDQEAHEEVIGDPFVGPFVEALARSRTEPIIPGAQEIKTSLQKQIEAAWFGQKSPEDALTDAAAEADRILQERGA